MLASINDYPLADGTFAGGFALGQIRISAQRIFDTVVPIDELNPTSYDRDVRKISADFQIVRIHDSSADADKYVADIDALIPSSGNVQFVTTFGSARYLINAELITHQLVDETGKATTHAYHIEGGRIHTSPAYYILTEDEFYILTEDGFKIETEH